MNPILRRLVIIAAGNYPGVPETNDLWNGIDILSLREASLETLARLESAGVGFVVTGYFGHPTDLDVDEVTRRWLTPVGSLGLSVRSMNCLRAAGISTVGELLAQTNDDLLSISNMGLKSVSEIRERINDFSTTDRNRVPWKRTLDLRLLLSLVDIDPELAPIASRTGCELVWEVCTAGSVALRNRLGAKSALQQLEEALERIGVLLCTVIPKWLPPVARQIRAAFANELEIAAESLRTTPTAALAVPAVIPEVSKSLADEIDRFILAGVKPEYKKVLSRRKGWDGGFGATLAEVGAASSLTRERVRQIEKKLSPIQPAGGFCFLNKALEVVREAMPCAAEVAEAALWLAFSSDLQIRIEGLISAAEVVGTSPGFDIERVGSERFVGRATEIHAMREIERVARADVSHYGVGSLDRVCAEIPPIAPAAIGRHLRKTPHCLWDPIFPSGFYLPTSRNSALSRLRRILSVVSPVSADVARTQILRDQRMEGSEFSPAMLSRIAQDQTWCQVVGEEISKADGFEADSEDSNEAKIVALLRQHGPVMDSRALQSMALSVGISDAHLTIILCNSPLIVRHDRALYGLVGSEPRMEAARAVPASANGFRGESLIYEASPGGAVDGLKTGEDCNVASPDFCLLFFAYMAKRARQLRGGDPWSIVEVLGSCTERRILHRWAREGTADVKWLRSRSVTYENEQLPASTALALLLLAYSAEVVRTESQEGEMWRQIRESLRPLLAAEFFFSNGNPRPWLREATELVCRRLRLRHAFGQEGEQGWLRTVYLQFGMTETGFKRLPFWLSGYGVPVAVEDLQDRSSDLFSSSFAALWEALGDYRIGARSEHEVRKVLVSNPWAGADITEELLANAIQRREIVRVSENTGLETIPHSVSALFSRPRLLWRDEPYFELSISPETPPWLEDSAYTLVVSDGQRMPIRRVNDSYEMAGVGSTLLVSARLPTIGIDVIQKRVSVLPDKIEIDFRPKSEVAFYRLSDGRMFDPWDDLPKGATAFAVLHQLNARLEPPASEFSVVLGGDWRLSAYRQGMPPDLCLYYGQGIVWQHPESLADRKESDAVETRIVCDGGKWGERKSFLVLGLPPHVRPVEAIIGAEICPLTPDYSGQISGTVTLEPTSTGSAPSARLIAREGLRLRSFRTVVDIGPVTGTALDHFGQWVPLHGTEIFPVHKFRERLFPRPPRVWKGENFEERDWAILEGDRVLDRPSKRGHMLIHSLFGLGEELRLAVHNRGEWWKGFKIVQGVVDTGLLRSAEQTSSAVTIELLRDFEIGQDHELWVWPINAHGPNPISRDCWRVDDGRIVAQLVEGNEAAIAISFKGLWLGAISLGRDHSWEIFKGVVDQTECWTVTAEWLRWFRIPVLLPNLRSAVRMKVEADQAGTFLAWTCEHHADSRASFSDDHRERWAHVIRAFLHFWKPTAEEAVQVLGALGVLPGDPIEIVEAFEVTREGWQNVDGLARIDPGIFSSLIVSALPAAYQDARQEERAVLVKILRKQIMGTDQELSLDEFSSRIGLDRRFASAVVNAESLRRERTLSVRIALADYSVRQFVCVRLLDDAMSQGLI